jgi:hypothetical protein
MASASGHRAHAALQPADCLILLLQRLPAAVEIPIGPSHYPAACTQSDASVQPSLRARYGHANSNSFVASVSQRQLAEIRIPISAAMRAFVGSITSEDFESMLNILRELWQTPSERPKLGAYLNLLWDGITRQNRISGRTLQKLLPRGDTGLLPLNGLKPCLSG